MPLTAVLSVPSAAVLSVPSAAVLSVPSAAVLSVPSAAVLSGTTSPSSTAITITGSVPSGSVVTGFEVRWQRDTCPDEGEMATRMGTITEDTAFTNSYQISGLEAGNRYTITVTVSNAAGTAPASNSVTGTTLETGERERESLLSLSVYVRLSTAPSAGPASVTAGTVTANSITVQWEEVPCLHRNGEITGYTVVARISGVDDITEFVNGDARSATVSGLEPSTQYTVLVAAVNGAGTSEPTSIMVETGGELVYINHCLCPCAWEGYCVQCMCRSSQL